MRQSFLIALLLASFGSAVAQTSVTVTPTTTLAAETANNTSAASTFTAQSNGNAGPGNVSKLPASSLLPAGSTTPVYAHFMPWFGTSSHMNVGYNSADPAQIARQVSDMLSRGIRGAIVDWYGPNDSQTNTTTLNLMAEAQNRNGQFQFAVMEDGGALSSCASNPACDLSSQIITHLTYAYQTFEVSPAYIRVQGRPVVLFFDADRFGFYSAARLDIDWARVAASVPGNPIFIFQNSGAYSHTQSGGAFSWIILSGNPADWGQAYLTNFYSTAQQYPADATYGATYKGFNDSLAGWGSGRVMSQGCGQTWLNTFSQINTQYPGGNLPFLQLVTWNDYEEGTELETGIDNCVALTASLAGHSLNWQPMVGSEATVDHYQVFISLDGTNLMPLTQTPAGVHTLDLSAYTLAPAAYTFYVEAIGRPSVRNRMSNAVTLVTGDQPPAAALTVTPLSASAPLTVSATLANSYDPDGSIVSSTLDFGDGTVVAGPTATHTYSSPGKFRVLGTVRDSQGSTSAAGTVVEATNQPPVVNISASTSGGAAPLPVNITTGTYDPDGTIASFRIDFGDGTSTTSASASHTYAWTGTYTITATATDNFGAVSHASTTLNVQGPSVTISSPAMGATVTSPAHVTATASSGTAIAKMTLLVDGAAVYTTTGGSLDTSVPLSPGFIHSIAVSAQDSSGAMVGTGIRVYDQNQAPRAAVSVSPASGSAPLAVTASTAGSSDPDGTITSSSIDFGDGTVVSGTTASHTYNNTGTYTVVATVKDNLGAAASARTTVNVGTQSTVTQPGVTVISPVAATGPVGTNVHVVASAASAYPITAMRVYLDSNSVFLASTNAIDTYLNATPGSHNLTVQAWDSSGAVYKNSQTLNVANTVVPQTGWWWDSNLSGTGFFIEYGGKSGNGMFVGGYIYDAAGNATWLVSTGPMTGATYSSTWLKATGGQTLLGSYKPDTVTTQSNLSIAFSDSSHAVMTRPDGTQINLQRFSFSATSTPAPPEAGAPQSGWWWAGAAYSGTGYGIEVQGNAVFIVAYVYDDAGNPVWYIATGSLTSPISYTGTWDLYAGGPQLTSPEGSYGTHKVRSASAMTLTFSDATHGTLTMGNVVVPISRMQEF